MVHRSDGGSIMLFAAPEPLHPVAARYLGDTTMTDLETLFARRALGDVRTWLIAPDLSTDTIAEMRQLVDRALSVMDSHGLATCDEISAVLGSKNWVIARRTSRIVRQYGDDVLCITAKQLRAAEITAIERRAL